MQEERRLSDLLHLFIDEYLRDRDCLKNNLESPEDFDPTILPLSDQLSVMETSAKKTKQKLKQKTLISRSKQHKDESFARLREKIKHSKTTERSLLNKLEKAPINFVFDEKKFFTSSAAKRLVKVSQETGSFPFDELQSERWKAYWHDYEEYATRYGFTPQELEAGKLARDQSREDIGAEILRFIADRIDEISSILDALEDRNFHQMIPEALEGAFRECHINYALGNYGTACILCGVVLEMALKDLIPSTKMLNDLIDEAKRDGLLEGENARRAGRIQRTRNLRAHGGCDFSATSGVEVSKILSDTRTLIFELYKDRKN
jgi:hypothetical protein